MDIITLLGILGATLVLVGFVGNRVGYWQASSQSYIMINSVGSAVLVGYSVLIESYPFVVLNVVWLLFSINGLWKLRHS